ncbi:hypothetical protein V6N13_095182 [Hibiscus sabdariffa]
MQIVSWLHVSALSSASPQHAHQTDTVPEFPGVAFDSKQLSVTRDGVLKLRKQRAEESWEESDQGHRIANASVECARPVWPLRFPQLPVSLELSIPITSPKAGNASVTPLSSTHSFLLGLAWLSFTL